MTQYVASSFTLVGSGFHRKSCECCGTDMVCDKADGNIGLMDLYSYSFPEISHFVAECLNGVDIEDGIYIL